jgi:hypothetical protein
VFFRQTYQHLAAKYPFLDKISLPEAVFILEVDPDDHDKTRAAVPFSWASAVRQR